MPSQQTTSVWQSALSVVLILHLFCLLVAAASNAGGQASPVARSLRSIPLVVDYLQFLGMDLSYEFALATGAPPDAPHLLQLSLSSAADKTLAQLPDLSMSPTRRRRYRQLAAYAADLDETFAENPDLATRLPVAVAETWIRDLGLPADNYVLRCRRNVPARLQKPTQATPTSVQAASDNQAFELQLVWSPTEQRYQAVRRQAVELTSQAL